MLTCSNCDTPIVAGRNKSGLCQKHAHAAWFKRRYTDPEYRAKHIDTARAWAKKHREKVSKRVLTWQKANPERVKATAFKTQSGPVNRFTRAKWRAGKRGLSWGLTRCQFLFVVSNPCTYCGGRLEARGVGLDRVDNSGGYTLSNVVPCCGSCNRIRGAELTYGEMLAAMGAVLAHRGQ